MALAVFEEWHDGVDMAFVLASSYEADVGGHAVAVDVGAGVIVEIVSADDSIRYKLRFDIMVFNPCAFCSMEGAAGDDVACVLDRIGCIFPVFRKDLRIRIRSSFFVLRNGDDDRIRIFLFDDGFIVDEACRDDGIEAVDRAVARVIGRDAVRIVEEVDVLARVQLRISLDTAKDRGAGDIRRTVGRRAVLYSRQGCICVNRCISSDRQHGFPSRRSFRDVEIEVLEISKVCDRLAFGIHIVRVVLAFGRTITAIEAHFRVQISRQNIDRIVICCAIVGLPTINVCVKRAAGYIDCVAIRIAFGSKTAINTDSACDFAAADGDSIAISISCTGHTSCHDRYEVFRTRNCTAGDDDRIFRCARHPGTASDCPRISAGNGDRIPRGAAPTLRCHRDSGRTSAEYKSIIDRIPCLGVTSNRFSRRAACHCECIVTSSCLAIAAGDMTDQVTAADCEDIGNSLAAC